MKWMRTVVVGVIAGVLAVGVARAQDVVKLGYAGPISGTLAPRGKSAQNGVQMALDEANAKGLHFGGRPVKLELIAEDDAADPKQGAAAAQKLCDSKVSGVVGHLTSGTSIAASRIYRDCGIPNISPAARAPLLTHQAYPTSFRVVPNEASINAGLLLAAGRLQIRKIAIVVSEHEFAQAAATAFQEAARTRGLEVMRTPSVRKDGQNLQAIVGSLGGVSQLQAIFFSGTDDQARALLSELDRGSAFSSSNLKILGGVELCPERMEAPRREKIVCTTGTASLERMPGGKAWSERYRRRYGSTPNENDAAAYDAANAMLEAMRKAGSSNDYLSALKAIDFIGVTGRIAFNVNGDLRQPTMSLHSYSRNAPDRADAPGTPCPDPCPTPAGLGGSPNRQDTPAVPPGCCGTPTG